MTSNNYDLKKFNCAHFVAQWYSEKLNIEIPVIDEFELSFTRWMRKHFTPIDKPEENALVIMISNDASHTGVYADNGVYHNYKPRTKLGSVVHWDLGVVCRNYDEVKFYKWSR